MGCKLFIALQLEVAHHFIERCAGGRSRSVEPPATFGATKTPKTRLLNPYQLPGHGLLCRSALRSSDCTPTSALAVKERSVLLIAVAYCAGCNKKRSLVWARQRCVMCKGTAEVYICQCGLSVGHPTHEQDFCSGARRFRGLV